MNDSVVDRPANALGAFSSARLALTPEEFFKEWKEEVEAPLKGLSPQQRRYRHYSRYNWDRYARVDASHSLSAALSEQVLSLSGPQTWLFITEAWCVDAAFSLPVIMAAAALRDDIDVRVALRDSNLELMDQYLSNGARAIPIFVVFDADGNELIRWGSKPDELKEVRMALKDRGAEGREVSLATVDWYEDEGWLVVERELTEAFSGLSTL